MTDSLPLRRVRTWALRPEEILGALAVLISRLLTLPRTPWELDEFLFTRAVLDFDPQRGQPHPPGYPLLAGLGKAMNLVVEDPWLALVVLSVIASVLGFIAFARAATTITGERVTGFVAALLFYFSSSMLVHGTLALSDATMLMFTALALLFAARCAEAPSRAGAILFAVAISAAIGTRPQMAIALVPVFLFVVARMATWRDRALAVFAMTAASLLWFVPLVIESGGWSSFLAIQTKQAAYFAAHDAAQSRGAPSIARLIGRFLIYPWEPKIVAFPVMLLAIAGVLRLVRNRRALALPAALLALVHGGFALFAMDPADGARYILPAMFFVAIAASEGLSLLRDRLHQQHLPVVVASAFAVAALVFAAPILVTRARVDSPPAQAAAHVRANLPPNTVILFDLSLRPHVEDLLPEFASRATESGLIEFHASRDVPLVHLADGGSILPDARTFSWPASGAYKRLTRKHYRVVSLEPIGPELRFKPIRGVWPPERLDSGLTWRWLAPEAEVALPDVGARAVRLRFGFSPDTPYDSNRITILVDGRTAASADVTPASAELDVPLPPGAHTLTIRSSKSFVPAVLLGNGDGRDLAVQLRSLEQR